MCVRSRALAGTIDKRVHDAVELRGRSDELLLSAVTVNSTSRHAKSHKTEQRSHRTRCATILDLKIHYETRRRGFRQSSDGAGAVEVQTNATIDGVADRQDLRRGLELVRDIGVGIGWQVCRMRVSMQAFRHT